MVRFEIKEGNFIKSESLLKGAVKKFNDSGDRAVLWYAVLEACRNACYVSGDLLFLKGVFCIDGK